MAIATTGSVTICMLQMLLLIVHIETGLSTNDGSTTDDRVPQRHGWNHNLLPLPLMFRSLLIADSSTRNRSLIWRESVDKEEDGLLIRLLSKDGLKWSGRTLNHS